MNDPYESLVLIPGGKFQWRSGPSSTSSRRLWSNAEYVGPVARVGVSGNPAQGNGGGSHSELCKRRGSLLIPAGSDNGIG
jgi:hypothetical protein